jgi:hypothetical protein
MGGMPLRAEAPEAAAGRDAVAGRVGLAGLGGFGADLKNFSMRVSWGLCA